MKFVNDNDDLIQRCDIFQAHGKPTQLHFVFAEGTTVGDLNLTGCNYKDDLVVAYDPVTKVKQPVTLSNHSALASCRVDLAVFDNVPLVDVLYTKTKYS